ncbi:TolC family protein [Geobacter sp.]|uniref:TolC family protein n=1 Tax=Geobacter sp. TaxID=46610 RepID=UPI002628E1B6|nr:TolC family protein [Geobacter sp.]
MTRAYRFVPGTVYLFLALLCLAPRGASGEVRPFTLPQAVEYALTNNGELKSLRQEKGVREAGKIRAGLYPNPVLDLDGTTGELSGSPSENRLSIGISQEFLTMGKRGKRLKVAEKEIEGFERQIDNSGRLLSEEVKTTFYDLLLAEKRVELAERSIALNNQLLDITKQRLEAGDIPELEVNLAQVEVARSEGRKVEAERELYPAKARLLLLIGLPPDEEARFSGSLEGKPFARGLAELKALALTKRPDLKALEAEKAKSDAEIALAQAERIPNITAGVGYQRENTAIDVAGSEVKDRDNLIGLKLSIPIPMFDRNQAGIREAQARKGSAENRYAFARLAAEREVEAAYARLTTAEKTLSIYAKDIIPQLEENLKMVREAYRLGEVGILTVIEEQKKFFEVNDGYLTALYNRQTALAKLEAAVGADLSIETSGGEK